MTMLRFFGLLMCAGSLCFAVGCASETSDDVEAYRTVSGLPFVELVRLDSSAIEPEKAHLFADYRSVRSFFQNLLSHDQIKLTFGRIRFPRQAVLVVVGSEGESSGFRTDIEEIVSRGRALDIRATTVPPACGELVSPAYMTPLVAVSLSSSSFWIPWRMRLNLKHTKLPRPICDGPPETLNF